MSFDALEFSLAGGKPVRLYQFSRGVLRWSYNSSGADVVHQNQVFKGLVFPGTPRGEGMGWPGVVPGESGNHAH